MGELFDHKYAEKIVAKWAPVLEAGPGIDNDQVRLTTAMILENTEKDFKRQGLITEESGMLDQGSGGIAGGTDPVAPATNGVLGTTDFHWPSIVIPMVRRIFPSLISHEIVGVQPMNGPIGFAFAFRARYGANGQLGVGNLDLATSNANTEGNQPGNGTEIGYNYVDSRYTGVSATAVTGSMWQAYAGASAGRFVDGQGQSTGIGEYNNVNDTYPMAKFELVKQAVEAKTRKLAANWSPELAEDMMAMHGIDVEAEMISILSYEIAAEIDRQLLNEQVKVAITGGKTSIWTPVSADGRNQIERIGTLLTQLNLMSNKIAETTRRGAANFCIASTRVTSVLQRLNAAAAFAPSSKGAMPALPNSGVGSLIKVGLINSGAQLLIRDTFAGGDYALLGYKGSHQGDSGIIYCPYIPVQMMKAVKTDNFTPEVGARTRYGVLNNVWGSANYYQFVACQNMSGIGLAGDDAGTRQFTFA